MWLDRLLTYLWRLWQGGNEPEFLARLRKMAAAREQLAGMMGSTEDGLYVLSADGRQIFYLSPGLTHVFQRRLEEIESDPAWPLSMIHPEDHGIFKTSFADLAQSEKRSCRYRIVAGNCEVRWVQDNARLVKAAGDGQVFVVGTVTDVTRQTLAELSRNQAETSLRLLERALAASANGIVITDMSKASQPIIYANAAFQRITGYSLEEVLGSNCRFLQGPHSQQPELDVLRQAISRGESCTVTLRNYRKSGTLFWNRLSISPIHDEYGRISHFVGVQQDISEVVESTRALSESERRLTLTFDAINEGVWDYFIQRDRVYVASSWTRIVGYGPEDLPKNQDALWFAIHPEDVARARRAMESHLKGSTPLYQVEYRLRCKDGHEIWVESRGRVVERDAEGQPLRMVGSITDITERYGFEQQIMEWNARMDSIFTLSPDGFVYFDHNRRVEYANPAFEAMTGMPIGQILNMDYSRFAEAVLANADPVDGSQPFRTAMDLDGLVKENDPKRSRCGQLVLLRPEHRVLAFDLRRTPNGESLVLYLRDVTRETEVDRMKSEFLSTAAHELRTPMASIMGFSELLLRRDYSKEVAKDLLETIHRQSKRLTNLLNELLDLARIEARGGKDFKYKHQSVGPIICDAMMALAAQEGLNHPVLVMADELPDVNVDEAKIQQAIMNVISNAYKYSPEGGEVKVEVVTTETEIGICVSDQGIGMSEAQLARLFERFYRADPSGNIPGTGLGMSLVKEILEHHQGRVEARSVLGQGSSITLWLPLALSLAKAA